MTDLIPGGDLANLFHINNELITNTAGYAAEIGGGTVKDVWGLLIGDGVFVARRENFLRQLHRSRQKLIAEGIVPQPVSPSIGEPLIQGAALEERDELIDLWVNLIAAAMDPRKASSVRYSFIEILRKMDPQDALLLKFLGASRTYDALTAAAFVPFDQWGAQLALENLCILGLLNQATEMEYRLSARGIEFRRAVGLT